MEISELKKSQNHQLSKEERTQVKGKGGSLIMVEDMDP